MGERIFHWVTFGFVVMGIPVIIVMAINAFIFKQFNIFDYTKDFILLAISVISSLVGIIIENRKKLNNIFIWSTLLLNALFFIFLTGLYFSCYAITYIPISLGGQKFLLYSDAAILISDFVLGIYVSAKRG